MSLALHFLAAGSVRCSSVYRLNNPCAIGQSHFCAFAFLSTLLNHNDFIMAAILTLNHIFKSYGRIRALQDVSFEVPEGTVFGILGPNGSGKTTLLSIVLDVLKADAGNFLWFGKSSSPDQRKKIGSLLETPNFYHYLSAVNNLRVTQSISERGDAQSIDQVLEKVKLGERKNSRFSSYSLGMKQRLGVAVALLGDPRVLVLDEPTNGLDPVGIAEMRELIIELRKKGHTIIMASHLLDEVEKICTHVAILKKGVLLTSGPVDEVLADEDIVEVGAMDLDRLASIVAGFADGLKLEREDHCLLLHFAKGSSRLDEINQFCFDHGIALNHLVYRKKRLEAKFFELTSN
jgi:ABC-2 type transport system ATP-binding protein